MSEIVENIHLRRLVRLRYVVMGGQVAAVLAVHFLLGVPLPLAPMVLLIAALAGLNIFTQRRLRHATRISPTELTLQLLADIVQLTGMLYLSGGYANPFMFMLLPPLAIAAAALATWQAVGVAALAVLCYSFLLVFYTPLPMLERLALFTPVLLRQAGMWVCFVVSAAMIFFFIVRTRQTLRQKDLELAAAREHALRNEHLAELGGLAAGTAHELGTPLATLSMLAEELEETATDADQREQLRLLRREVYRCRDAIDELARSSGAAQASDVRPETVGSWLEGLAQRWRDSFPGVAIGVSLAGHSPEPALVPDRGLEQALSSVVSNACRASDRVEIGVRWNTRELVIEVLDRGPGFPPALRPLAGREPLGEQPGVHGMGLGLYLAAGNIERIGGRLALLPCESGGTQAEIRLPLNQLRAENETHEQPNTLPVAG